jgi:hypothetical protein
MNLAIVIFADIESHSDPGRAVNALLTAREADECGDDVRVIFDGAGTGWAGVLADPGHCSHPLYASIRHRITGACLYCANAFGHTAAIEAAGIPLIDEYRQHPSLRSLVHDGFTVITF